VIYITKMIAAWLLNYRLYIQ